MYQRPKFNESDEDLLKLQEEFFRNKEKSNFKLASTVVSAKAETRKPSASIEFDLKSPMSQSQQQEIQEHLDNTFEDIPQNCRIGTIVENKPRGIQSAFKLSATGFPQAKRRDLSISSGNGSIFSQQMKKLKSGTSKASSCEKQPMDINISSKELNINEKVRAKVGISQNDNMTLERKEIHLENLDKISKMTPDEILEEKERLMSTLDPAIVAFLKSKQHHNQQLAKIETRQPSIAQQNKPDGDTEVGGIMSVKDILDNPQSDKWINFNLLEGNKLVWMQDIATPEVPKGASYEARFDFSGWLLPFTEEEINDQNRVLYHHGEEPGRPGYTLQELFQLCRSNVIQQKIIALNTIAAILNIHASGMYDHIIEIPIEQVFFVLRFCLDENTTGTLGSSIKALRNLFCNSIDEACLDCLWGFGLGAIEPNLGIDENPDDDTVNDQQLAEQNLVKCLLRSGILTRIRYIFNVVRPCDIETVANCLDILVRLARDSEFVVNELVKFDGLIESVVRNFMPKVSATVQSTTAYNTPMSQAVKLIRVLVSRSKHIALEMSKKYKVLDSVASYLSNDHLSVNNAGLKLQIESLKLWEVLLFYGLDVDHFKALRAVLLRLVDYHLKNTNVDSSWTMQTHIAAIINYLAQVESSDFDCVLEYVKIFVENGLPKWLTQFLYLNAYSCGQLQLISSLLHFLTKTYQFQQVHENIQLPWKMVHGLIEKILASAAFTLITEKINSSSNFLNNYEVHSASANLKYSESVAWNAADHIVPILQTGSCIPFLNKLAMFISICDSMKLKEMILKHKHINAYLTRIQCSHNFYLTSNWYTKVEAEFIVSLLKIAVGIQTRLDTALYYEVAVKSLCVFTPEMKCHVEYLFANIIFCRTFYPSAALLRNLNIADDSTLETALEDIANIQKVYVDVLGLRRNLIDLQTQRVLNIFHGNIMPLDWIYSPIIALYSNNEQSTVSEVAQNFLISNCLRWVYVYETYFPDLAKMINATDKFCRLACTFLGSDTLFLIPEIQLLLRRCLELLLSRYGALLEFDKAIHGLKSFRDLYTQLLEQYQGVSYGDKLFGQFLLVPLAQRHNVELRKAIWSEYAGVVQVFNVTEDELMVDVSEYLEPAEEDASLLNCYRRIVTTGALRRSSILYKIATHHINAYRNRLSK